MSYIINPYLPRLRMEAVNLVRSGQSIRKVARHFGFSHGVIINWLKRAPADSRSIIPTRSSRPWSHPKALSSKMVETILRYRRERDQCAFILHHRLLADGYQVSLSSVKRTLKRNEMTKFSKWKKWHQYPPRPIAEKPGILVQIDTILDGEPRDRLCVYTSLDVCSRFAFAKPSLRVNTHRSLRFVEDARDSSPFEFQTIQSDHRSEFSKWFTKRILERGMAHRHSRIRTPNDNAHLERFNRTIQDECLKRIPKNFHIWQKEIPEYLRYYNEERPHMGLEMKTPIQKIAEWSQAIEL